MCSRLRPLVAGLALLAVALVATRDGVYLVGDMVAAPGLLSEVTLNSALEAVARLASRPKLTRVA